MTEGIQECDFCGAEEWANTSLRGKPTVQYNDGAPRATVPNTILCFDCAKEVSDYLEARSNISNQDTEGLSPFGEADAETLLDRLRENEHLVMDLERGSGYGIRAVNGEWRRAIVRLPGPAKVETLSRKEVRDLILDAKRLTLKHFDPSAWKRFERTG